MKCQTYHRIAKPRSLNRLMPAPRDITHEARTPPGYTPKQVLQAMGWNGQASGVPAGRCGFLSLGGYDPSPDIQAALRAWGLPPANITIRGTPGVVDPNGADVENALDGCWLAGIVTEATGKPCDLVIAFRANDDAGISGGYADLANAGCVVGSCSWGLYEGGWSSSLLSSQQTLANIALVGSMWMTAASGDSSANDGTGGPAADFPASSPSVVGVGGTAFLPEVSRDGGWTFRAWGDGNPGDAGGGGGLSRAFAVPSYQSSLGYGKRAVPDVAGPADPAYGGAVYCHGQWISVGGTSWASPVVAALLAVVRGVMTAKGVPVNPVMPHSVLYGSSGACCSDVVVGSDGNPAQKGYDLCTGWGIPLLPALLSLYVGTVTAPLPPPPTPPLPPVSGPVGPTLAQVRAVVDRVFLRLEQGVNPMLRQFEVPLLQYANQLVDASLAALWHQTSSALVYPLRVTPVSTLVAAYPFDWQLFISAAVHAAFVGAEQSLGEPYAVVLEKVEPLVQDEIQSLLGSGV